MWDNLWSVEIRTWGCGVRSASATSVLCRPFCYRRVVNGIFLYIMEQMIPYGCSLKFLSFGGGGGQGGKWNRGGVCASHPAATGSNLSSDNIFLAEICSLLLSSWTVEKSNPSSAKQWILQIKAWAKHYKKSFSASYKSIRFTNELFSTLKSHLPLSRGHFLTGLKR